MSRSGAQYLTAGQSWPLPMTTGLYYGLSAVTAVTTQANPPDGTAKFKPFWVNNAAGVTATRLAVITTLAGSAGAVGRLGIYRDNGAGKPGALVLDAGTVDETATAGQLEVTISQALGVALYWLVYVPQGAPATHATIDQESTHLGLTAASAAASTPAEGWQAAGVAGALPDPAPAVTTVASPFAIWVKV